MHSNIESIYLKLALVVLSAGIVVAGSSRHAMSEEIFHSVPKASCGPHDRTETVQGETTLAERFSPGRPRAYNCNLELVGQFEGEGAGHDMNAYKTCAYYSTFQNPALRHPGVAVLDVSDSRHPQVTAYLDSPAMLNANESLEFDATRQLFLGVKLFGTVFDIYDVSADCRHPVLKDSVSLPGVFSHSGQFTHDGRTYYGGSYGLRAEAGTSPDIAAAAVSAIYALDTSDPEHLRSIATWTPPKERWRTHSVSINQDGTRAYVVLMGNGKLDPTGLVILDVSDIQVRRPNPQFRIVSTLF